MLNLLNTIDNIQDAFSVTAVGDGGLKAGKTKAFTFAVGKRNVEDAANAPISYGDGNDLFGFKLPNMTSDLNESLIPDEFTVQVLFDLLFYAGDSNTLPFFLLFYRA